MDLQVIIQEGRSAAMRAQPSKHSQMVSNCPRAEVRTDVNKGILRLIKRRTKIMKILKMVDVVVVKTKNVPFSDLIPISLHQNLY